jgi:hypothetical protein
MHLSSFVLYIKVARAVKDTMLSYNMNLLECQCMKEGKSSEECGFAKHSSTQENLINVSSIASLELDASALL